MDKISINEIKRDPFTDAVITDIFIRPVTKTIEIIYRKMTATGEQAKAEENIILRDYVEKEEGKEDKVFTEYSDITFESNFLGAIRNKVADKVGVKVGIKK